MQKTLLSGSLAKVRRSHPLLRLLPLPIVKTHRKICSQLAGRCIWTRGFCCLARVRGRRVKAAILQMPQLLLLVRLSVTLVFFPIPTERIRVNKLWLMWQFIVLLSTSLLSVKPGLRVVDQSPKNSVLFLVYSPSGSEKPMLRVNFSARNSLVGCIQLPIALSSRLIAMKCHWSRDFISSLAPTLVALHRI